MTFKSGVVTLELSNAEALVLFCHFFFSSLMQTQNTPAFSAQTETCAIALMISLLELYVP